ncbi:MAG: ComEC/Rec2 family competence protein [Thermomicrobiales bacterium]
MSGVWVGCAVVAGVAFGVPAIVAAIVIGVVLWYARQWSAALAIVILLATTAGVLRGYETRSAAPVFPDGELVAVRGDVDSVAATRATSQSFVVDVKEALIGGQWQRATLRLWVTGGVHPTVGRQDRVFVSGSFEPLEQVEPGFAGYLAADGIDGTGFARRVEIDAVGTGWRRTVDDLAGTIRDRLQAAVPGDRGILLSGFVTGDDARLSKERNDRFIATGTTHLTAVSGANIALLLLIVVGAGRRFGLRHWSPWLIVIGLVIWAYAVLVGLEPPVVRAAIVATLAVLAARLGRRPDFVTLIVLAAAMQVLVRPEDVHRLAFQLSVAASLALVLVLSGGGQSGTFGRFRYAALSVSAAQIATVAILVPAFGTVSWTSLPANMLVAPAASVSFALALVASMLFAVSAMLGTAVAMVAGIGSGYVIAVVDILGRSSDATVRTGAVGPMGRIVVIAISVGGVAMMSAESRQAVSRWWRVAVANQESVAVVIGSALVGAVGGWIAAGMI